MAEARLIVLYPHPTDRQQFDRDYKEHLKLLHEKLQLAQQARPYTVTRFAETPVGKAAYYQMFSFPFPSAEALQQALNSPAMAELAADAVRISSGGAPVFLAGIEAHD
jgi:uncharacterized protein (TIGR02118 family)